MSTYLHLKEFDVIGQIYARQQDAEKFRGKLRIHISRTSGTRGPVRQNSNLQSVNLSFRGRVSGCSSSTGRILVVRSYF